MSGSPAPPISRSAQDDAESLSAEVVGELLANLLRAMRASQLYERNNPAYLRFIDLLAKGFRDLWGYADSLRVGVEEHGFAWEGQVFEFGEGRDSLAFRCYRDGIRLFTFLPGFEEEVHRFLGLLRRSRRSERDHDGDDLVTMLWEEDLAGLRYAYVELGGDELPYSGEESGRGLYEPGQLRADLAEEAKQAYGAAEAGPAAAKRIADSFEETLYFIEGEDLRALAEELEEEWTSDPRGAVVSGLLDRLEDRMPARQDEILSILWQIVPGALSSGDLGLALSILDDVAALMGKQGVLGAAQRAHAEALFRQISEPEVLEQFIFALQDWQKVPAPEKLSRFLAHLGAAALPTLLVAVESMGQARVTEQLQQAVSRLAQDRSDELLRLLDREDMVLVTGAARQVGWLRLTAGAPQLIGLLDRSERALRRVAVEALIGLRTNQAVIALQDALQDTDREVRITAVRGLAALGFRPARARIEEKIKGRAIREADLSEQVAFFEAYGALAGGESVEFLDEMLNGRGLWRRRQPSELRACSALALGAIATPAAREALERSASDSDPVVRAAVGRALRGKRRAAR